MSIRQCRPACLTPRDADRKPTIARESNTSPSPARLFCFGIVRPSFWGVRRGHNRIESKPGGEPLATPAARAGSRRRGHRRRLPAALAGAPRPHPTQPSDARDHDRDAGPEHPGSTGGGACGARLQPARPVADLREGRRGRMEGGHSGLPSRDPHAPRRAVGLVDAPAAAGPPLPQGAGQRRQAALLAPALPLVGLALPAHRETLRQRRGLRSRPDHPGDGPLLPHGARLR